MVESGYPGIMWLAGRLEEDAIKISVEISVGYRTNYG